MLFAYSHILIINCVLIFSYFIFEQFCLKLRCESKEAFKILHKEERLLIRKIYFVPFGQSSHLAQSIHHIIAFQFPDLRLVDGCC